MYKTCRINLAEFGFAPLKLRQPPRMAEGKPRDVLGSISKRVNLKPVALVGRRFESGGSAGTASDWPRARTTKNRIRAFSREAASEIALYPIPVVRRAARGRGASGCHLVKTKGTN